LSDYELLELLLFRALPRRDVKPLAKTLLAKFGSFAEVIAAPEARLAEVKGLGGAGITEEVQQTGTVDHTPVYPREVVKRALEAIIAVAGPLGIAVHDHLIVGKDGHASLKGLRLI